MSIDPTAPWPHANRRFPGHLRLAPDTLGHPAPRAEAAALVSATLDPPTPHPNLPGREDTPLSTCSGLLRAPCWAPPGRRSRAARGTGARHLVALGGTPRVQISVRQMWPIFLPLWTRFTPLEVEASQGRVSDDPLGGDRVSLGSYGHRPVGSRPPGWLAAWSPGTLRNSLEFCRCRDSGAGLELRWNPGFATCCVTLGRGPEVGCNLAPLGTARPWHVVTRVKPRLWG